MVVLRVQAGRLGVGLGQSYVDGVGVDWCSPAAPSPGSGSSLQFLDWACPSLYLVHIPVHSGSTFPKPQHMERLYLIK